MTMTDPNTPIQPTNNPQDLIDQALGSTPTPAVTPDPSPTLPVPEALTPPAAVTEEAPMSTESVLPPTETVPTELTAKPEVAPAMSEPPVDTKPMGEDMPLAFVGAAGSVGTDTNISASAPVVVEPVNSTVPPSLNTVPSAPIKNKKKGKVFAIIAGFFLLFMTIGTVAYNALGDPIKIAGVTIGKNGRPSEIDNPGDCNGESNGGWLVWRNGACKVTGISGNTDNPDKNTENPNTKNIENMGKGECQTSGSGGQWCESIDSNGKAYAFCMKNDGSQGNCNNKAIEKGYTIQIGKVENVSCECRGYDTAKPGTCVAWEMDAASQALYAPYGAETLAKANGLCNAGNGNVNFGNASYICKEGKKGKGGDVYTGGACTENNGYPFSGKLGCFCGTVQVDTPTGHTSYESTCGCDKDNPEPSTPTITTNPTLMCSSLTRTPTTTPEVGDKVTFTCVGASTPAGAVSLTYKFRYSLNSGAYVAMTNKTATTSELTIASCGSYKVQCQACGTINGVLTCDPNWTAATQ